MDWHLRPAAGPDREFVWRIHRSTMRAYVAATWGAWDERWQRARFDEHFDPAGSQIIVVNGSDVGVLVLEERDAELYLASLQISPERQGSGLGSAVIRSVVERAARRGLPVSLQVLKSNPSARKLYERLGFRVSGETATHHLMQASPAPGVPLPPRDRAGSGQSDTPLPGQVFEV